MSYRFKLIKILKARGWRISKYNDNGNGSSSVRLSYGWDNAERCRGIPCCMTRTAAKELLGLFKDSESRSRHSAMYLIQGGKAWVPSGITFKSRANLKLVA